MVIEEKTVRVKTLTLLPGGRARFVLEDGVDREEGWRVARIGGEIGSLVAWLQRELPEG